MKIQTITLAFAAIAILSSCKKEIYGCTDTEALNYSTLATKDDGSCHYTVDEVISTQITISNWTAQSDHYSTILPYGEITSDVTSNGAVITYLETGTNIWSSLPYISSSSTSYNTYFEASVTVGQVIVKVKNTDGSLPAAPSEETFKIVVLK